MHLVAKGYSQKEGVDFSEVFYLVVKHSSIMVLLTMVTLFDLELEKLDVKIVFLHGELEKQIILYYSQKEVILLKDLASNLGLQKELIVSYYDN